MRIVPDGDLSGNKENFMKLLRISLVCSLLLLAATPSFALPCEACTAPEYPYCEDSPGSGKRCIIDLDTCRERTPSNPCSPLPRADANIPTVLAEWTVASIEVTRPSEGTKVTTSPAATADASTTAPQK